ncbi:hypothetical protein P4053_08840 [Pseudomonas aeruginosa]|nr:hypothetical protein [Pseudomonas aeruginosa]
MAMHATSDNLGSKLKATSAPRKIDLAEEMALHGVDVPQEISEAIPSNDAVFLGYQQRWFEDESPIMIAEKSRRTGLTWAEAGRNVINAAKPRRRGGCNTFYVGSKQEMALEYIAACALFARAFNELAEADVYEQTFWDEGKKEEILTYMIRFPKSGRKIQALSSRPSNLRGLQGDVVIDEAAFHESLEELLKAALALTMWGNKVRLISTHNGVDNPFNQYIQDAREGRKDYSVHRITLDDAIVEGLYKRICFVTGQEWSPEAEKAWRDGLYKNAPIPSPPTRNTAASRRSPAAPTSLACSSSRRWSRTIRSVSTGTRRRKVSKAGRHRCAKTRSAPGAKKTFCQSWPGWTRRTPTASAKTSRAAAT